MAPNGKFMNYREKVKKLIMKNDCNKLKSIAY